MSVHYASTPALSSNHSVESNSVNSDDYDLSSTGSSSVHYPSPGSEFSGASSNSNRSRRRHPNDPHYCDFSSNASSYGSPARPIVGRHQRTASVTRLNHPARLSLIANISGQEQAGHDRIDDVPDPHPASHRSMPIQHEPGTPSELTVSEDDIRAIEGCYRGHKTRVFVCSALANLYNAPRASTRIEAVDGAQSWSLMFTGIPVLLLDLGNTKSRQKRQIQILLVEKGTCFTLWRDVIDNLSKYTCQDAMFHVMHLSHDHLCRVGLSFDHIDSAKQFHSWILMLTSDPANIALKGPSFTPVSLPRYPNCTIEEFSDKAVKERKKQKYRKPSKAEISLPCGFQHVVSVDMKNGAKFFSVQAFVQSKQKDIHERMIKQQGGNQHNNIEPPVVQARAPESRQGGIKSSMRHRWDSSPDVSNGTNIRPSFSVFPSANSTSEINL
eukprot:TCALIF_07773-PA protein Name:"Protein of unknown function" AED:0.24 eAED:0.25 QI:0/-1/0/1/-1/1/1/0/439